MPTQELGSYVKTQVETATPLQLVVMLYDGAIDSARKAKEAIAAKDVEKKTQAVDKLLAIVGELQSTLDMDRGGEIAANLNALYAYFCEQVVTASVQLETAPLEDVENLLVDLRSAWHEISQRPASELAPPATGAATSPAGPPPPERKRVSVRT